MEIPKRLEAPLEFSSIMLEAAALCIMDALEWGLKKVDDAMDVWDES